MLSGLTVTGVDLSGADDTWHAFTFASVSLTAGDTYFFIIHNTHVTPASNSANIVYRGGSDGVASAAQSFRCGFTSNGFTGDPTLAAGAGCGVIKFDDGSVFGNPYVNTGAPPSSSDDRGNRFQFDGDLVVSGVVHTNSSTVAANVEINKASDGTNIVTRVMNFVDETRNKGVRFAPVTLAGGVAYDVVVTYASATSALTIFDMGEAEGSVPADVLACVPFTNGTAGYVTGTTPGSYTLDKSKTISVALIADNAPAIAGGTSVVISPRRIR